MMWAPTSKMVDLVLHVSPCHLVHLTTQNNHVGFGVFTRMRPSEQRFKFGVASADKAFSLVEIGRR